MNDYNDDCTCFTFSFVFLNKASVIQCRHQSSHMHQPREYLICSRKKELFYPWVMYLLTTRVTQALGLPKPCLFFKVQRDVVSLPSYSKLNSKCNCQKLCGTLVRRWLVVINYAIQLQHFGGMMLWHKTWCYLVWEHSRRMPDDLL